MPEKEVKERKEEYLKNLAERLVEERNAKGLTQQQLADKTGITREKINYAELNISGRKLQIEDLGLISEVLEVDIGYLLGIKLKEKEITNKKQLEDMVQEKDEDYDMLGLLDDLLQIQNETGLLNNYKVYIIIRYMIENILISTLNKIKTKVKDKKEDLNRPELQKIETLMKYMDYFKIQKVADYAYEYGQMLVEKYVKDFEIAKKECENILIYNENKNVEIEFESFKVIQKVFDIFSGFILNEMEGVSKDRVIERATQKAKDEKFFYRIRKYLQRYFL